MSSSSWTLARRLGGPFSSCGPSGIGQPMARRCAALRTLTAPTRAPVQTIGCPGPLTLRYTTNTGVPTSG